MSRLRRALTAVVAALTLSGCGDGGSAESVAPPPWTSTATTTASPASPLPAPEALADVLYRLSDAAVPGADKLTLVEGAKPADAATIDKFANALRDGGYLPLNLEVTGLGWSDRHPGYVTADVAVKTANPDTAGFSFPMEFKPTGETWQLSQDTAKTLLAFGNAHTESTPTP
ncbi:hypothetical protein [[Mycobacterium] vasticus]|uniref:Low molecular weight antigen MTB12-like C-terminal domain-containing protein n=1 Tax=[Mycobacterium] vasticus TaxID=2875777 RepID=A0ABU5Z019_9MYCO|nr:hypothetical protein [Mycolicibacter sp. MYC017]MEB3070490.1 hypothetical protein [Mycolicibacter sp. MYC017]